MRQKGTIINDAAEELFFETGLEGVLESDKGVARRLMNLIWKIAFKRGRARGWKDIRDRPRAT